jgi:hypothetical protein
MKYSSLIVLALAVVGCTKAADSGDDSQLVAGFNPPPAPEGYTRYIMPAVYKLQPGEDKLFCQWIDLAPDQDVDIVDVQGYQTITGHHVVLYSTSETAAVGETHECTTDDMVSVQFLGGIGGEGGGNVTQLPAGYVFRQGKGRMLLANTHYLNATDSVQDVQSVIDVKTAAPSAANTAAGMAVMHWQDFQIPANSGSFTTDAYCTWTRDTSLMMWSNHMHADGLSVYTEVKRAAGGAVEPLVADTTWHAEYAFNPTWKRWTVDAPMTLHAGDQVHISCTWKNPTAATMGFPDEMCDGVGFYMESPDEAICEASAP